MLTSYQVELNTDFVRCIKPCDKDQFFWDSRLRGYGLRVKPTGVKSFFIQYRDQGGRSKRYTIGRFGDPFTGHEAFKAARDLLAEIRLGGDPVAEKKEKRLAMTVKELCAQYLKDARSGNVLTRRGTAKSASTLATDAGRIKRHVVPLLGNRRVKEVTRADLKKFYNEVRIGKTAVNERTEVNRGRAIVTGGQGTAKRTLGLLSGVLSHAVDMGIIETNPAHGLRLPGDGKRVITNLSDKYAALGRCLELAEKNCEAWQAVSLVKLIAFTGMRRAEAIGLKWSEVDFDGQCIRLQTSKTGQSVRPIGKAALEVLRDAHNASGGQMYVYPALRSDGQPYGGFPRAWNRMKSNTGLSTKDLSALEDLTPHGLRHGFATTANTLGLTLPTIGALLGHSSGGVTADYISQVDSFLIASAGKVSNRIAFLMNLEPEEKVVLLKG